NAWWELDLGAHANIDGITLWNRTDCCAGRLSDFYVLVSDQPFLSQDLNATINQTGVNVTHHPAAAGRETYFPINDQGRYVRIQLAGTNYLTLAEVEVMGCFNNANTCTAEGNILMERWDNIGNGFEVSSIPLTSAPSSTSLLPTFEIPVNSGNTYGARVRGYICPPTTGNYSFWIASDDKGELWLSTDDNPANKALVAHVPGWTSSRLWTKYPEQQSDSIYLEAGRSYYVEALVKENLGGDNLAVGWTLPDGSLQRPIAGTHLSPWDINSSRQGLDQTLAEVQPEINIFPNPIDKQQSLTISFALPHEEQVSLHVFTMDGRVVFEDHYRLKAHKSERQLQLSSLPSGMYMLRLEGENWQHTERLILQ
ncbi:MAG: T9SS type A sorting domain-containing protein, partial [Bacteroidota bacterium]